MSILNFLQSKTVNRIIYYFRDDAGCTDDVDATGCTDGVDATGCTDGVDITGCTDGTGNEGLLQEDRIPLLINSNVARTLNSFLENK